MGLFKRKNKPGGEQDLKMEDVIPRPITKYKIDPDNRVVLLKPKFHNAFLREHLIPRMKHAYYKIHLDDIGTATWKLIDGKRNALQIAAALEAEMGTRIQPTYERLGMFLRMLKNGGFIDF